MKNQLVPDIDNAIKIIYKDNLIYGSIVFGLLRV